MEFQIGDIVELSNGEEDEIYTGIIISEPFDLYDHGEEDYYKVKWLDADGIDTHEHYTNLRKVS